MPVTYSVTHSLLGIFNIFIFLEGYGAFVKVSEEFFLGFTMLNTNYCFEYFIACLQSLKPSKDIKNFNILQ